MLIKQQGHTAAQRASCQAAYNNKWAACRAPAAPGGFHAVALKRSPSGGCSGLALPSDPEQRVVSIKTPRTSWQVQGRGGCAKRGQPGDAPGCSSTQSIPSFCRSMDSDFVTAQQRPSYVKPSFCNHSVSPVSVMTCACCCKRFFATRTLMPQALVGACKGAHATKG